MWVFYNEFVNSISTKIRKIEIMGRDKKSDGRALNMVLLRAPGDVLTHQDPDPAVVRAAVEELVP